MMSQVKQQTTLFGRLVLRDVQLLSDGVYWDLEVQGDFKGWVGCSLKDQNGNIIDLPAVPVDIVNRTDRGANRGSFPAGSYDVILAFWTKEPGVTFGDGSMASRIWDTGWMPMSVQNPKANFSSINGEQVFVPAPTITTASPQVVTTAPVVNNQFDINSALPLILLAVVGKKLIK